MNTSEVDYAVLKPFPVQMPDGERLDLEPGDVVPREVHGRWLFLAQEAGKVAPVTLTAPEAKPVKARATAKV